MDDSPNDGEQDDAGTSREIREAHEFARKAREEGPVSIELNEEDLFALSQGRSIYEVLKIHEDRGWIDYLEVVMRSGGALGSRDVREEFSEVIQGVDDAE